MGTMTLPSSKEEFQKRGYLRVANLIPVELADTCTRYAKAMELYAYKPGDSLAPNSHSAYSDFLMESVLQVLRPRIEALTGLSLWPTYSYYRVYKAGEELREHTDRNSCEISCTLCLGYDYRGQDFEWPIKMADAKIALEPGEAVIYRGMKVPHSRPKLQTREGSWHAQLFLHYVEKDGPNAQYKFDRRPALYLPEHTRQQLPPETEQES